MPAGPNHEKAQGSDSAGDEQLAALLGIGKSTVSHHLARLSEAGLQDFRPGVRYSEKRVNEILSRYSEDTARLRRSLVEFGFMDREGGGRDYWLKERSAPGERMGAEAS